MRVLIFSLVSHPKSNDDVTGINSPITNGDLCSKATFGGSEKNTIFIYFYTWTRNSTNIVFSINNAMFLNIQLAFMNLQRVQSMNLCFVDKKEKKMKNRKLNTS